MTIRIVYDPQGREVWKGESETDRGALIDCWMATKRNGSIPELMTGAGYTVKEAPRMVEVPLEDLVIATGRAMVAEYWEAVERLRTIVDRERGR